MKINCHIERLVIEGVTDGAYQGAMLGQALQQRLAQLLAEDSGFGNGATGAVVPLLQPFPIQYSQTDSAAQLGSRIADGLYRSINT